MSSGSRKLAVLFLAIVVPAAGTLIWLGLTLLRQDRELWAHLESKRREVVAADVIRALDESLNAVPSEPEAARFLLGPDGIAAEGRRVVWLPTVATRQETGDPAFADADALEIRGVLPEALARYQVLARSKDPSTRAGALKRIARVHWQRREWDAALAVYRELATIGNVVLNDMPASLLARRASCSVLEEAGRTAGLARAATALRAEFVAGHWTLDGAAWALTNSEIARWTGQAVQVSEDDRLMAAAAERLWSDWQRGDGLVQPGSRRRVAVVEGAALTFVERTDESGARVTIVLPSAVNAWVTSLNALARVSIVSESGDTIAGARPTTSADAIRRTGAQTELPWTVLIEPGGGDQATAEIAQTERLLTWGLAVIVLLLAAGSYLLWRVIQQELAVARLQTEFVAAVSHEFRTPLASLRHVTELLAEDDDLPRDQRQSFYRGLERNTERLSRLVESLLDFARMEGGRRPYSLRPVDARALAAQVVAQFQADVESRGFAIRLEADDSTLMVSADKESLAHALWNLLDNAVKYSPDGRNVSVFVRRHAEGVIFGVQDSGLGIPRHERGDIFRRFVRGAKAYELGVKGTGLGLAMVSHIVAAHHGRIELETEEGLGSTFRVVLPAAT